MKSTISKILGIAVTLTILASMLVTGTALPASAAVGTMAYGSLSTPGTAGKVLINASEIDFLAVAADGKTIFAYDNTAKALYKSTNAGTTFSSRSSTATGLTGVIAVGIAISPNFATDNTMVVASATTVYVAVDGGTNFNQVQPADLTTKLEGGAITSVDMGVYYQYNRVNIVVSCMAAGAGVVSNVLRFDTGDQYGSWVALGNMRTKTQAVITPVCAAIPGPITGITVVNAGAGYTTAPTVVLSGGAPTVAGVITATVTATGSLTFAITTAGNYTAPPGPAAAIADSTAVGDFNVYAVKFSPAGAADTEIMAVAFDNVVANLSKLYSSFIGGTFGNAVSLPLTATAPTTAVIATGTDYNGMAGAQTVAIGLNGGTAADIYRVAGRSSGTPGIAADLNLGGVGTDTNISSIAFNGPAASATVLVGTVANVLYRTAAFTGTPVFTAPNKAPSGTGGVIAVWAGTNAVAGTKGTDSAVSVSTDGGVNYNGTSLIEVTALANVTISAIEVADANNIFLVMNNPVGPTKYLFRTSDGGTTWTRVMISSAAGPTDIGCVSLSPAYATDKTLFVSQGTGVAAMMMIYKSVDNGNSFTPMIATENSNNIKAVDGTNFYYSGGATTSFYKVGRFANATFPAATTSPVYSIAMNPKDATKATWAVGLTNGRVYQSTNDGVSFSAIGTAHPNPAPGTDAVIVAYGPDGSLYAMGTGASGIYRWTGSAWLSLAAGITNGTGLVVTPDGTLYASTINAGAGVYRSLNPNLGDVTDVTPCEFQQLSNANFPDTYGAAYALADLTIVPTATVNTLYAVETTTVADTTTYGYTGRVYGFKDTFIVGPTQSSPADKAVLTTTTTASLAWTAFTGATLCEAQVNAGNKFVKADNETVDKLTTTSARGTDLAQGSTYYWRVRATSVEISAAPTKLVYSRWSTIRSFITALVQPNVVTVQDPTQGATDVPIDTTFTWPSSVASGTVTYEFVIAEELGNADKFAIIDDSATTTTNAYKLREALKYDTQYWWRVRAVSASSKSDWTTSFFTTAKEPAAVATSTAPAVTQTIIVPTQPAVTPIVTVIPAETKEVIPTYLLWAIIAVGAILVIAVIVLIVRTRRIS